MTKINVSAGQVFISTHMVTIGTVFFPVAGVVVPLAGVSGWMGVLLGFVISIPWVLMATSLVEKVDAKDWGDAVFQWLGPYLGRVFLLYFAFIWTWLGGYLLLQTGVVFNNIALPATPTMVLTTILLMVVVFTDLRGLEVFLRTLQVLFLLVMPLIIAFVLVKLPNITFRNVQPVFGTAPILLAHAAYLSLPWVMEGILYALFIGTMVKRKERLRIYNLTAILGAGVILSLVVLMNLLVLGQGVTESYVYPTFILARVEPGAGVLPGAEAFLFPLWILASYVKVTAAFIMVTESIRGVYRGLKQPYRTLGVAAVFYGITFIPRNTLEMVSHIARVDNTFFMLGYGIVPLLLLYTSLVSQKGAKKSA